MRWRNHYSRYYLDRYIRFETLHDKFKGILSFEGYGKKEMEALKELYEHLWIDTFGITSKEVMKIAEEINRVFHKEGYVIPHDKIEHFVVEVMRKK